jgi:hypothetical protein
LRVNQGAALAFSWSTAVAILAAAGGWGDFSEVQDMRNELIAAGAAALLIVAGSAHAQLGVGGGLRGSAGGAVGGLGAGGSLGAGAGSTVNGLGQTTGSVTNDVNSSASRIENTAGYEARSAERKARHAKVKTDAAGQSSTSVSGSGASDRTSASVGGSAAGAGASGSASVSASGR